MSKQDHFNLILAHCFLLGFWFIKDVIIDFGLLYGVYVMVAMGLITQVQVYVHFMKQLKLIGMPDDDPDNDVLDQLLDFVVLAIPYGYVTFHAYKTVGSAAGVLLGTFWVGIYALIVLLRPNQN